MESESEEEAVFSEASVVSISDDEDDEEEAPPAKRGKAAAAPKKPTAAAAAKAKAAAKAVEEVPYIPIQLSSSSANSQALGSQPTAKRARQLPPTIANTASWK